MVRSLPLPKKARKEIVRACLELRVPVGLCKNEKHRQAH